MTIYRIEIPESTPSLNEWERMHWAKRRREKLRWQVYIGAKARGCHLPKATGKRNVLIIRYGAKRLDRDNLYGGMKGVLDAIKDLGYLVDDAVEWCHLECDQQTDRARPRTVIEIEDES